jgi:hypothetical protein
MKNRILADKYPIHVLELEKRETRLEKLDQVLRALEERAASPSCPIVSS